MTRYITVRQALLPLAAAWWLVAAAGAGSAVAEPDQDHAVIGRFSITSDAGGAVWAFQPGGALIIVGPGELVASGAWSPAEGEREFDATVDIRVTGQTLAVLGQVSPDRTEVALHVTATEPTKPYDWVPWPPDSHLTGQLFGMAPDASPAPTPSVADCAGPESVGAEVDRDRCDDTLTEAQPATASARPGRVPTCR